ncbi:MAG: helix-hairpin-helix domain-containing protein [Gammaproteobacteria bacterium]|nr:helix-hairpin-helix domain-containing protein [Gammaproteobacteria bacterium]
MKNRSLNKTVAELFRQMAEVLTQQQANPFRINAYRRAAETIEALDEDVGELLEREGIDGLVALPFVGKGTAASIQEIARTGRLSRLDRLRGELEPELLFQTVPGIGPALAEQLIDELHVDSLEGLEVAAHDGRLEAVKGVGTRRAAGIRSSLADMLGRRRAPRRRSANGPDIGVLLNIDRAYRMQARAGKLPKIAPRRFNPQGEAWLPIMHANRGGWHFTALFSNTARAHQLRRTRDWVVIYFSDGDHREGQHTIVTETRGPLKDLRVVRGREADCRNYYRRGGRVVVNE